MLIMSKREYREPEENTRAKMSAKKAGVNNPMYGKAMPDDVKRKISDSLRQYWSTIPSKNNNELNTEDR